MSDREINRVLLLRHGILLNRFFLLPMERDFERRGYYVHNASYRSRQKTIEEHAAEFAQYVRELDGEYRARGEPHELYAITHSLGGLVFRYALTHFDVPEFRRAVLMVPPNQGAQMARRLNSFPPFRWLYGSKAGRQLTEDPEGIFAECGVPDNVEAGVIAGSVNRQLYPVRIEKPNDGVVAVSEAALPPYPLTVLPYGHTPILFAREAWDEAAYFLEHGQFRDRKVRASAAEPGDHDHP